jgi:hypothetical protein
MSAPAGSFEQRRGRRTSLSPASRRGRREVVIHHNTMDSTAVGTQFPMLTRTNYHEWAMLMHVTFEAAGWWYVVEPEEDEVINYRHDRLALTAILRSVLADMLLSLRERRSSVAAAWEAIKRIRIRVQRVREANTQQIRREFEALVWKEAETTEDFMNRITGLAVELRLLDDNITDVEVVQKILQVLLDHLT